MMEIIISQAEINTAQIEIKTITVKGRQMTLAVYRQIPELKPKPNDNPILWGTVNYCGNSCKEKPRPHWHVLWQDGNILKKFPFSVNKLDGWIEDDVFFNDYRIRNNIDNSIDYIRVANVCGVDIGFRRKFKSCSVDRKYMSEEKYESELASYKREIEQLKLEIEWNHQLTERVVKLPQLFIAV